MYTSPPLSPPASPSAFVWTCHACNLTLPLAVTTRCLSCSHSFCAGRPSTTSILPPKPGKKTRRAHSTKACGSTFDYQGWQVWGEWRRQQSRENSGSDDSEEEEEVEEEDTREGARLDRQIKPKRNCERDCDFPSQCRWAPRLAAGSASKPSTSTIPTITSNAQLRRHLVARQLERAERRAMQETLSFSDGGSGDAGISETHHHNDEEELNKHCGDESEKSRGRKSNVSFVTPVLDFVSFKAQGDRWFESSLDGRIDALEGSRSLGSRTKVQVVKEEEEEVGVKEGI